MIVAVSFSHLPQSNGGLDWFFKAVLLFDVGVGAYLLTRWILG